MKPSVQHSQRGVASHEARHEQNGRGVRLMPGMQKGRIADQAGELEAVAKLASQRQIHRFTDQEGRNLTRTWVHVLATQAVVEQSDVLLAARDLLQFDHVAVGITTVRGRNMPIGTPHREYAN